jgi:uncharacterized protein
MIDSSPTQSDRIAAMAVHVAGIFFSFFPALIVYLAVTDNPWLKEQSRNALNFQLTLIIGWVIGILTSFIGIGVLLIWAVEVGNFIFSIVAALRVNGSDTYRYPATIELVKPS